MSLPPSMHLSECLWMSSLLLFLFLLFLSSLLKVLPSSGLCDAHHLLSMLPPPPPAVTSSFYSMHPLHPSLPATSLPAMPFSPSSIHPSLHAPSLPHHPPTGDTLMYRGAYRRPSLSWQPLVLGVKGKPSSVPAVWGSPLFSHSFVFSFFTQYLFILSSFGPKLSVFVQTDVVWK